LGCLSAAAMRHGHKPTIRSAVFNNSTSLLRSSI
jgi:hypothetical protein